MDGLDVLLMTDWEIWITLIILGGGALTLMPLTPDFARPRRRGATMTVAVAAAIAGAALLASYSLPPVHTTAELVAETGRS